MKVCTTCKEEKDTSCFYKKRNAHEAQCKACKLQRCAERYAEDPGVYSKMLTNRDKRFAENPEAAQADKRTRAEYRKNNWDKIYADSVRWCKDNPESRKATHRKWQQANRDITRHSANKRRATKLNATPTWAESEWDQFIIAEACSLAVLREQMTGVKWHVDHIVPLQSNFVCGLHCANNIQVITAFENISKGNRYWPDM